MEVSWIRCYQMHTMQWLTDCMTEKKGHSNISGCFDCPCLKSAISLFPGYQEICMNAGLILRRMNGVELCLTPDLLKLSLHRSIAGAVQIMGWVDLASRWHLSTGTRWFPLIGRWPSIGHLNLWGVSISLLTDQFSDRPTDVLSGLRPTMTSWPMTEASCSPLKLVIGAYLIGMFTQLVVSVWCCKNVCQVLCAIHSLVSSGGSYNSRLPCNWNYSQQRIISLSVELKSWDKRNLLCIWRKHTHVIL